MLRHLPWAIALAACSFACSSASVDGEGESADDQLIETGAPIKPVDLLSCWTVEDTAAADAFFTLHKLVCQKPAQTAYPLVQSEAIVEVRTARSRSFSSRMTTTGDEITIGGFATADLPLTIQTRLIFPKTSTVGDQFALKRENKINRLADATKTSPLAFKSPFTLWGVAIRAADGGRLFLSGHYEASSGDYRVGWNFNIPETDPQTLRVNPFQESTDGKMELGLIAPASGTLKVSLMGRDVDIAGPGTYVWDGESLTRDVTVPAPPVPPDVVEPPPAPTCGADGQARCADGTCAPAHRYDSSTSKCRACGSNGQTYCYDSNAGARFCAPGHRLANDTCVSCGSDGQTYCYDANAGARFCAPGHRLANDTCTACGTNGKTYCYDSASGSRFCQPNHRIVNDICTSCGAEGQTYCYDSQAGRRFCNEGLRVVNDTCTR